MVGRLRPGCSDRRGAWRSGSGGREIRIRIPSDMRWEGAVALLYVGFSPSKLFPSHLVLRGTVRCRHDCRRGKRHETWRELTDVKRNRSVHQERAQGFSSLWTGCLRHPEFSMLRPDRPRWYLCNGFAEFTAWLLANFSHMLQIANRIIISSEFLFESEENSRFAAEFFKMRHREPSIPA